MAKISGMLPKPTSGISAAQSAYMESLGRLFSMFLTTTPQSGMVAELYAKDFARMVEGLNVIALSSPEGATKAEICANFLRKSRMQSGEALEFLMKIAPYSTLCTSREWQERFRRGMKCSENVRDASESRKELPATLAIINIMRFSLRCAGGYEELKAQARSKHTGGEFQRRLDAFRQGVLVAQPHDDALLRKGPCYIQPQSLLEYRRRGDLGRLSNQQETL